MSEAAAPGCACTLYAVVRDNGDLVRGCQALDANKPAGTVGVYGVRFNRAVENCAWVATIGLDDDGVPPRGHISVAGLANPDGVQVRTFDCDCKPADLPFHLAVHCCGD
ncbi:MAG: hypothetical protein ACRDRX_27690 [Pseudonocardiaceae bacterium]